jgi:phosphoribosylglycinamide formyltransferase 2
MYNATMKRFGTPGKKSSVKILMLGSGELGKEVVIEAQRLGVETIACDRYESAPAMQVAHRSYVFNMRDGKALRAVIEKSCPRSKRSPRRRWWRLRKKDGL